MDIVQTIALCMGVAWASGINLYAAIGMLGILGATGNVDLPPDMEIVQHPAVIVAAGFMYCVEFFADKVPGVDTGWDAIHGFIRIPAAAALAAAAVGEVDPAITLAAAIVGGALGATSYTVKAGGRVLINTSPEPVTNWTASFTEDLAVIAGLWAALYHPEVFLVLLVVFILVAAWLLPKVWRGIKAVFRRLKTLLGGKPDTPEPQPLAIPESAGPSAGEAETKS